MSRLNLLLASGCLLALAASSGCRGPGTFNMYNRISIVDFKVNPPIQSRVASISLSQLKETSMRWIQSTGRFAEVTTGPAGTPDTLFVEGTIIAYRQHRIGKAVATGLIRGLTGVNVDIRGESIIDYRFYDATGRVLFVQRIHARYRRAASGMDPTAEEAGYQLARLVAWHKDPFPPGY